LGYDDREKASMPIGAVFEGQFLIGSIWISTVPSFVGQIR
jgi:hypothetical protein